MVEFSLLNNLIVCCYVDNVKYFFVDIDFVDSGIRMRNGVYDLIFC